MDFVKHLLFTLKTLEISQNIKAGKVSYYKLLRINIS